MSQYFDKDFFKFLLGFVAIILVSLITLAYSKFYQSNEEGSPLQAIQTATP